MLNPEIRRNLWLEFTMHRTIAMPVVLTLIFLVAAEMPGTVVTNVHVAAMGLFFLLVKIWGGHKAAASVIDEVNDNTWDFQRLSALTPLSLTLGKLLGSTSYIWYGSLPVFAIFCLTVPQNSQDSVDLNLLIPAQLLLSGLIVLVGGLFFSLLAIQGQQLGAHTKFRALPYHLAGLFAGGFFMDQEWYQGSANKWNGHGAPAVSWYGHAYSSMGFMAVAAVITLAWLVLGAYCQMRYQMKMRNSPFIWMGFLSFCLAYLSGFDSLHSIGRFSLDLASETGFGFIMLSFYAIAINEGWNLVRYRRLLALWKAGHIRDVWVGCPRWLITLPFCFIAILIQTTADLPSERVFAITLCMLSVVLFAVRDIAILHFFKLFSTTRRYLGATLFYWGVLYALLPFLFSLLHLQGVAKFLLPISPDVLLAGDNRLMLLLTLIPGALQATFAIMLVAFRWRNADSRLKLPKP
jgi:hypothetical protein